MLVRAIAALGGVCLVYASPVLPSPALLLVGAACAAAAAATRHGSTVAWCLAGVVLASLQGRAMLDDRLDPSMHGRDARVIGTVVSLPDRDTRGGRFVFAPDRARHPDLPARIRVAWYLDPPLPAAGARWALTLRLRAPRGFVNPHGFDYERWMLVSRYGASAYVRTEPPPRELGDGPARRLMSLRAVVDSRITGALGAHPQRGIIRGLVLGERGELDAHHWEVFAHTGTSHLIAISGLHIGLVAGFVAMFVRSVAVAGGIPAARARMLAAVLALAAAAGYAALAGLGIPTRRAWVMLAVGAWVLLRRRFRSVYDAWAVALVAVLAVDPSSVASAGFWLSFGAVFVIAWQFSHRKGTMPALVTMWRVQLAAGLGLLPLTAWFFQQGAVSSPFANLVAVPVFSLLVVPSALFGALLSLCWPGGGEFMLRLAAGLAGLAWAFLERVASWPWANLFTAGFPRWMLYAGCAGVLCAIAPRGFPLRWAGVALVAALLAWRPPALPGGNWRMTVLEVGHGLATVFRSHSSVIVYDTGPSYGPGQDAGSRVLVPYLRAQGVRRVDLLVVSHPHDDHQGGADTLRASLEVERVLAADPAPLAPGAEPCRAGQSWTLDGLVLRMLHPRHGWEGGANDISCVLEIEAPGARILLPGDVEWRAELELSRPGSALRAVDVLQVPHHGSTTSSLPRFVQRTRPSIAVIGTGFGNRWGFPAEAVMRRWEHAGAEVRHTARDGALVVEGSAVDAPGVRAWRRESRRWWRLE